MDFNCMSLSLLLRLANDSFEQAFPFGFFFFWFDIDDLRKWFDGRDGVF